MKYKIYHLNNGFISGILEESLFDTHMESYETNINFDNSVIVESDLTDKEIFFNCFIKDGLLKLGIHPDRLNKNNLKIIQTNRQREYPSFEDQFDLLYHGGYEAWKAVIQSIKQKYPKSED